MWPLGRMWPSKTYMKTLEEYYHLSLVELHIITKTPWKLFRAVWIMFWGKFFSKFVLFRDLLKIGDLLIHKKNHFAGHTAKVMKFCMKIFQILEHTHILNDGWIQFSQFPKQNIIFICYKQGSIAAPVFNNIFFC